MDFFPKQWEFILNSTSRWNLAHGSVRAGKTVCTLFRFLQACNSCPDSQIYMVGKSSDSVYENVIRLIMESPQLSVFKPFCVWQRGDRILRYKDKVIKILGAKDEGALGNFQGKTFSLVYCDEFTLYPDVIIEMLRTRMSQKGAMGFASMNPQHPDHILKKWIDSGIRGEADIYSLHFTIEDNTFLEKSFIDDVKHGLTGLYYKRYYLGEWCLAEGSIFDFFDTNIHVIPRPPTAAEYWIASIDVGTNNPFACLLIGINTGRYTQNGVTMWVEKEYYYDPKVTHRQKTNAEFADDILEFLEPYGVKQLYIDPSAAAMKLELQRRQLHPIDANNSVLDGINIMISALQAGKIFICADCKNLIREIQTYSWDAKAAKLGEDKPLKVNDHAIDALRYALATHKVPKVATDTETFGKTLGYQYFKDNYRNF